MRSDGKFACECTAAGSPVSASSVIPILLVRLLTGSQPLSFYKRSKTRTRKHRCCKNRIRNILAITKKLILQAILSETTDVYTSDWMVGIARWHGRCQDKIEIDDRNKNSQQKSVPM